VGHGPSDLTEGQRLVLDDIRRERVGLDQARHRAWFARVGPGSQLTPEQREESARFWDEVAGMIERGDADWL
jgi:hypothetical protein